ncbi:MAG TPA: 23S rRNA (adenine(2503)-C(2))-methyltransferase RlmN [Candidatus Dormibacteraeota bacterium]|jgi:23S rRNA (adenine2503-C2)-methyltransferase|nr:23S rRNA (adenine(2503)-C(2))-methyltransferase RlmN [Candidatus Dormibacteraeota bacterium]
MVEDLKSLQGMDPEELTALVIEAGEPGYRAKQIMEAVYRHRVESLEEISTLPQEFREKLAQSGVSVGAARIENKFLSVDGTVRYLIGFADGQSVETVWMPEGDGGEAGDGSEAGEAAEAVTTRAFGRSTICISSQVGCAVDCQFCLTALLGVKRNLTAGEIVGQVCAVLKDQKVSPPEDRINLVFMGMGEPFLNYENFIKASRLLVEGVGIAERRMTVSTAGIVPRIRDFGEEKIRPKLAISLNASNDALRTQLMPVNKKWTLEMLMAAAREFPLRTREWITFEYVLLGGVNDTPENAREVAELLRGLRCKVNLIALNPGPGIDFRTPSAERVTAFQNILRGAGIPAYVRRPRGRDIYAACGQLKRTVEAATSPELQQHSISPQPSQG